MLMSQIDKFVLRTPFTRLAVDHSFNSVFNILTVSESGAVGRAPGLADVVGYNTPCVGRIKKAGSTGIELLD